MAATALFDSIYSMFDVDHTVVPADGDTLVFSAVTGKWVPAESTGATGSSAASGVVEKHDYIVTGTPRLNDPIAPPFLLDQAWKCNRITMACGTAPKDGPLTVQFESSPDGATYSALDVPISIPVGVYWGVQPLTADIPAGTLVRARVTAVNRASDITVILYLGGQRLYGSLLLRSI